MQDFSDVYVELKAIMLPYAAKLVTKANTDTELYVETMHVLKNKKPLFFGAVQVKKNYVSFHLMPIYVAPELLNGVSSSLRKRMHGKSCFNFTQIDKAVFHELAALAACGFAKYKALGYV